MSNQPYSFYTSNHHYQQEEMRVPNAPYTSAVQGYQSGELVHPMPQYSPVQGYPQHSYAPVYSYRGAPQENNQVLNENLDFGRSNGVVSTSDMGPLHSESRTETYRDPMGNLVQNRQQVIEDQNQIRNNIRYWFTTATYFLLGLLEIILLMRFIFRLLGASRDAGFITLLYGLSHPFVAAFNGIFNDQTLGKAGVFEFSTLIAMIIYALLAWGLIALVRTLFAPVQTSRRSVMTTRRGQF